MLTRRRIRSWGEDGQELVEFALILPLLLLILFGIIEFGIAIYRYNAISNIGREVARYGAIHPDDIYPEPTPIAAYITEQVYSHWATGMPTATLLVTPTITMGDFLSTTIHVTVTYEHQFLTGPVIQALGGDGRITMRSTSAMQLERPLSP